MYYIYAHTRKDTNQIFYIGKGQRRRAWDKSNRNKHWHHIANKSEYSVDILAYFESEKEAIKQEVNCIKWLDNLCNMTNGGEGLSGLKFTQDHKNKISEANKGKILSPEHKDKISKSLRGKTKGKVVGEETKLKISLAMSGNKHPKFKGNIIATNVQSGIELIFCGLKSLEIFGFNSRHVYNCINGRRKSHKGYIFRRESCGLIEL